MAILTIFGDFEHDAFCDGRAAVGIEDSRSWDWDWELLANMSTKISSLPSKFWRAGWSAWQCPCR